MIGTGIIGAGVIVGSIVLMFVPHAVVMENPVRAALQASPLVAILSIVVAVLGIVGQIKQSRNFTLDSYNHWTRRGGLSLA